MKIFAPKLVQHVVSEKLEMNFFTNHPHVAAVGIYFEKSIGLSNGHVVGICNDGTLHLMYVKRTGGVGVDQEPWIILDSFEQYVPLCSALERWNLRPHNNHAVHLLIGK